MRLGQNPWEIIRYIADYSSRQLTFPSDAVNAFQGILNIFGQARYNVIHLFGVPLMPPYAELRRGLSFEARPWSVVQQFIIGLTWFHLTPSHRRDGFPSWSWAGWTGEVAQCFSFKKGTLATISSVSIELEKVDGALVPLTDANSLTIVLTTPHSLCCTLRISSMVSSFSIEPLPEPMPIDDLDRVDSEAIPQENAWGVKFELKSGLIAYSFFHLDKEVEKEKSLIRRLKEKKWVGILLGNFPFGQEGEILNYKMRSHNVVIIDEVGDHMERIGIFNMNNIWAYKFLDPPPSSNAFDEDGALRYITVHTDGKFIKGYFAYGRTWRDLDDDEVKEVWNRPWRSETIRLS